jgi:hypothetical protein
MLLAHAARAGLPEKDFEALRGQLPQRYHFAHTEAWAFVTRSAVPVEATSKGCL